MAKCSPLLPHNPKSVTTFQRHRYVIIKLVESFEKKSYNANFRSVKAHYIYERTPGNFLENDKQGERDGGAKSRNNKAKEKK